MKINKLKRSVQGFTIIEVMIVLAIAALILLVVFLAVPALQRAQRNNGRKSDVSRISAAIVDFVSNNNNALPGSVAGSAVTNCSTIVKDAGTLDQYGFPTTCPSGSDAGTSLPSSPAVNSIYISYPTIGGGAPINAPTAANDVMIIVDGAICAGPTAVTTGTYGSQTAAATNVALLYTLESGSGYIWDCNNVQ